MPSSLDLVTGHELAAGMLLLAGPRLTEPTFGGAVILLLDYGQDGAVGVVLNRPTEARLGEAMPLAAFEGFGDAADAIRAARVMEGGPVDQTQLLALVGWHPGWIDREDRLRQVLPGAGLADLMGLASSGEGALDPAWAEVPVRAYVGYAGWGSGQLEGELADEAWYVLPADSSDPFGEDPDVLWHEVVARQEGRLAWLGLRPSHVELN